MIKVRSIPLAQPRFSPDTWRSVGRWGVLAFILALFAIFLVWPILQVVRVGFMGVPDQSGSGSFTLAYIAAVFQQPVLREGLLNSALIAICVTLTCLLISMPLAILMVRYDFPGKSILGGLLLVPLILPPFVGAIGMRQIVGRFGLLTSLAQHLGLVAPGTPVDWLGGHPLVGIVLVEALSLYPILYLNLSAALANLDPALDQAAANLGASRWTILRRITLPLLRPGLFAGATIVLIWSFTELGTPLMFDYTRATPVQVFRLISQVAGGGNNPLPYALVVVMLAGSTLLYIAGKFILGRGQNAAVTKGSTQAAARRLSPLKSILVVAPIALMVGLALLPHLGVVLISVSGMGSWYQSALPEVFTLAHYRNALSHDLAVPSVVNSIKFAGLSTVIDVGLGLLIAWLLVRSRIVGKGLIDALTMLPLAVPGMVLAFGYLAISLRLQVWFKDTAWLKNLANVNENPVVLLVIAYAFRRLPYVVRSAVAGLQQTPVDLELAALNLGAGGLTTLRRITVPLIAANLIAGALLAFAFAMLEVSDSLILAQKQAYWPITKAIYELAQRLQDGPYIASALGVWAMVLLTLTILSANSFLGKKMGAIFRI